MIKQLIHIRTSFIFALIFSTLNLHGDPDPGNYIRDIDSPFHDVFYLYYNNDKKRAIQLLKKQFNNKKFKNQAYINYGLILEYENNFAEAEKYYRTALGNNERISILYLYDLYKNHDREKLLPFLLSLETRENCWILYEKAVYYLENGDRSKAIECLSLAIDNGFSSADLLQNDPVFTTLTNTAEFKRLMRKAKENYSVSNSISQKMKEAEYEYKSDKPYGTITEIDAAAYYEKTGRDKKALNILKSVLNSNVPFRDKSTALFRLASINARKGNKKDAKKYLRDFIDHISGQEKDSTGYKDITAMVYKDIILNDEYLKKIAGDMEVLQ